MKDEKGGSNHPLSSSSFILFLAFASERPQDHNADMGLSLSFAQRGYAFARRWLLPWGCDLFLLGQLGTLILLFVYQPYLNHDCGLMLSGAVQILDGQLPFFDTNPPMSVYLNLPPAILSRVTGMSALTAAQIAMFALLCWTLGMMRYLLPRTPAALNQMESTMLCGTLVAVTLFVYQRGEFGQREQIFVLLYLPYLLLRFVRYAGGEVPKWLAIPVGVTAMLGIALKPYFVAIWLMVEIFQLAMYRRWRATVAPEVWAALFTATLYALHFWLIPGMGEYFTRWVPLLMAHYSVYAMPRTEIVREFSPQPQNLILAFLCLLALWLALRLRLRLRGLLAVFVSVIIVSWLTFWHQAKNWSYHLVPVWLFGGLLAGVLLILLWRMMRLTVVSRYRRYTEFPAVVMAGLFLLSVMMFPTLPDEILQKRRPPLGFNDPWQAAILQYSRPGEPVMFLHTSVFPAFPATTLTDRRPCGRFAEGFPLALFYDGATDYRTWDKTPPEERRYYEDLCAEMRRYPPRIVFVSTMKKPQACPDFFSVDEYFQRRGFYVQILNNYQEKPPVAGFRVFVRQEK